MFSSLLIIQRYKRQIRYKDFFQINILCHNIQKYLKMKSDSVEKACYKS